MQNRSSNTPITPPPNQTQKFNEVDFSVQPRGLFGKKDNLITMLTHSKVGLHTGFDIDTRREERMEEWRKERGRGGAES